MVTILQASSKTVAYEPMAQSQFGLKIRASKYECIMIYMFD